MILLPIFQRELRVRARRVGTHWGRATLAGFAGLLAVQILVAHSAASNPAVGGRMAYDALSWLAFLTACATALLAADGICRERREGTLGLMFLTDLKGHDVVLGKLATNGLDAFFAMLGFTPALALTLVAGGVTGGEVARAALAVFNTLLFALSTGLWISIRARSQFQAIRQTAIAFVALTFVPLLAGALLPTPVSDGVRNISPLSAFRLSREAEYVASPALFWWALAEVQVAAWALIAWASRLIMHSRSWETEIEATRSTREARRLARAVKRAQRRATVALHTFAPVPFLVLRQPGQRPLVWAGVVLCALGSQLGVRPLLFGSPLAIIGGGALRSFSMMLHAGGLALLTWVAARFFLEARRKGEIELLLCTPVGARTILTGQWHGLIRLLQTPLVVLSFANVPYAAAMIVGAGNHVAPEMLGLVGGLLHIANGILDVLAICWVGMWFGLRSTKPAAAIAWTVGLVALVPWLATSLLFALSFSPRPGPAVVQAVTMWNLVFPFLYLCKNAVFVWWAREKLRHALRTEAVLPLPQGLNHLLRAAAPPAPPSRGWVPA